MDLFSFLKSGLKGLCPNCNKADIFVTRFKIKDKCSYCNMNLIEDNGDNWFFLLIIDRALFIFPIITAYYFNLSPIIIIVLSISLLVLFIIFTPFRLGICLAFVYYMRTKIKI